MFGYLPGPAVCCQKAASTYRAHFCGLGTHLHRSYGAWARWLVNRDSAFLTLLGSALTETTPALCQTTCCNRFATPRDLVAENPVLQYTGAVTVCGLSAKLDDDAQDERGWRRHAARFGAKALDIPIGDALGLLHAMRFPVQEVRAWMAGQTDIENRSATLRDCARPTSAAYGGSRATSLKWPGFQWHAQRCTSSAKASASSSMRRMRGTTGPGIANAGNSTRSTPSLTSPAAVRRCCPR